VFSNAAANHLTVVTRACRRFGITVDAAGASVGKVAERPGELLAHYDVVFAKARCALEAMASGAAVVLCDAMGAGPLVTSENLDRLRPLNFGLRTLRDSLDPDVLAREIARYDAADAIEVSRRIRATADRDDAIDDLIDLYEEVIAEWHEAPHPTLDDELRAASDYLRRLTPDAELSARHHFYMFLRRLYLCAHQMRGIRGLIPARTTALRLGTTLRRGFHRD
jgi:hypothetical protein